MLRFSISNLNQWVLDFDGNTNRILKSIRGAKSSGSRYRLGPELEVTGYGCEDHYYELDTFIHSWECIATILQATANDPTCRDIVCDVSAPIAFPHTATSSPTRRYNCRLIILNGIILLIRPKMVLADQGVHRESRWFLPWVDPWHLENYPLPEVVSQICGQEFAPFGCTILRFSCGTVIGFETCEELWVDLPEFRNPHVVYYQAGAQIIFNASASHHELRKLKRRIDLVSNASAKGQGIYAYTNLLGCDGGRTYFDGGAIVAHKGSLICLGERFCMHEIHSSNVSVKLPPAFESKTKPGSSLDVDFELVLHEDDKAMPRLCFPMHSVEEEIALAPALWLWDNLRRSGLSGFFLCLSGGLDSTSVACLVYSMCQQLYGEIQGELNGSAHGEILGELQRMTGSGADFKPQSAREICSLLLTTCYMPNAETSSESSKLRAEKVAAAIGCRHLEVDITSPVNALLEATRKGLGLPQLPRFASDGGSSREDLALQNVQARCRLVAAYLTAQLLPSSSIVLSSGNLDEAICGYFTKYDCSSADLNPIGSIGKEDLRRFLVYFAKLVSGTEANELASVVREVLATPPTAELTPQTTDGKAFQTDESDIGLTYADLFQLGALRKREALGPLGVYNRLLQINSVISKEDAFATAEKVKLFFRKYAANRHKAAILPPAMHMESYSCDDNRFDLRPYVYRHDWPHQFGRIDDLVSNFSA